MGFWDRKKREDDLNTWLNQEKGACEVNAHWEGHFRRIPNLHHLPFYDRQMDFFWKKEE